VGAGLAGLRCAVELAGKGLSVQVLEASDAVGGRMRTDEVDGFLLDRGFQVWLTAYPECQSFLDYAALKLGAFRSGAIVRLGSKFHKLADPIRHPGEAINTMLAGVGAIGDKMRMAQLRSRVSSGSLEDVLAHPEQSTLEALRSEGFGEEMINGFFRPFFGGIYLEPDLATSSRKFEFVFRMFSEGEAALPAGGIGRVPLQLASRLPEGWLRLNTPVDRVEAGRVFLRSGELLEAKHVVVAVDEPSAGAGLLPGAVAPAESGSVTCLYFDAPESPVRGPWLVLNGEGPSSGPINNLGVPSEACAGYAPEDRALVSVSVLGASEDESVLLPKVMAQLSGWYGEAKVSAWRHLRSYRIPYALPMQKPGSLEPVAKNPKLAEGLWRCGDLMDVASSNGALASGRRVGESILRG